MTISWNVHKLNKITRKSGRLFPSIASPVQGGKPRILRIATVWRLALGKVKEVFHMLASPVQGEVDCRR